MSGKVRLAALVGVLAVIALIALLWLTVLGNRMAEAGKLQDQAAQVDLANLSLLKRQRDIQDLAAQAPALAQQAQELFAKMPQSAELPLVLDQISAAATDAGIKPADIALLNAAIPQNVAAQGPSAQSAQEAAAAVGVQLATMGIDMTVSGEEENLLRFIDNLQSLDRALLLTSTTITWDQTAGKTTKRTLTARATLFVLQSSLPDLVAKAEQVIADAQAQAQAQAGTTPTPAPTPSR